MRGHSGKSAAPRERQLCGPEALLVAVPDVRLRLGFSPTTSPSPRWRAYMAAGSQRQARCRLFSLILLAIPAIRPRLVRDPHRPSGARIYQPHLVGDFDRPHKTASSQKPAAQVRHGCDTSNTFSTAHRRQRLLRRAPRVSDSHAVPQSAHDLGRQRYLWGGNSRARDLLI